MNPFLPMQLSRQGEVMHVYLCLIVNIMATKGLTLNCIDHKTQACDLVQKGLKVVPSTL